MRYVLCILAILFVLPAGAHDIYSTWKDNKGMSCCNNRDCRPAQTRVNGTVVEVLIDGEWVPVPPDKYIKAIVPDMQDHVCHVPGTKNILCFAPGGGV